MRLHLHLLRPKSDNPAAPVRPRVAMTEFWPDDDCKAAPVTNTFGSGGLQKAIDVEAHPTVAAKNPGLRGMAILLIRSHAPGETGFSLEGELADSLYWVARDPQSHSEEDDPKPTWLQSVFGIKPPRPIPKAYIDFEVSGKAQAWLGENLQALTLLVYVHDSEKGVLAARTIHSQKPPLGGKSTQTRARPEPVPPAQYTALADELEGEIDVSLSLRIEKEGSGVWINPEQERRLPIDSTYNVQLRVNVVGGEQAYLYVVWIDSIGVATPLFPWLPQDEGDRGWDDPTADSRNNPVKELKLPDDIAHLLPDDLKFLYSKGDGGAETFVVLAHRQQIELSDVRSVFVALPKPQAAINPRDLDRLERLRIRKEPAASYPSGSEETAEPPVKAFGSRRPRDPDPLATMTMTLGQAFRFRVDSAWALVVPSRGGR